MHVVTWFAAGMVLNLGFQGRVPVTAKSTGQVFLPRDVSESENELDGDVLINIDIDGVILNSDPRALTWMFYTGEDSRPSNGFAFDEDSMSLVDNEDVSTGEGSSDMDDQQSAPPLTSITGTSNLDFADALTKETSSQFNTNLMKSMYEVDNNWAHEVNQLVQNKYDTGIKEALNYNSLHIIEMASLADDVGKVNYDDDKWKYINEVSSSLDGTSDISKVDYFPKVSKTNLDEVMDFVLQLVNSNLIRRKREQIPIPDIHKVFNKTVGSVTVQGKFNALQGYFKNLATIRRTGDVTVDRVGSTLQVACALGLGTMQVGYNHYDVELQARSGSGTLTGTVGTNSISMKATMAIVGGGCKATLNELKLEQFKDMKVTITGLGPLGELLTQITNWITEHFQTQIVSMLEKELNKAVMDILGRFHCEHLLTELYWR